ncbi:hypothetical protein D3C86_1390360 [compost metagenome]
MSIDFPFEATNFPSQLVQLKVDRVDGLARLLRIKLVDQIELNFQRCQLVANFFEIA